jgi:hypothetical protein
VSPDTFTRLLFFVDETWQDIEGRRVAALGGVALPQRGYNAYCRAIFAMKKRLLGATELNDAEMKGVKCFAKRTFRTRASGERSRLLDAADEMFRLLQHHHARTFVMWTDDSELTSLRTGEAMALGEPYRQLLYAFRAYMRAESPKSIGTLNFDQRDLGADEAAACALQNFMVRQGRRGGWPDRFITVPSFTVSAVSPGLQAADLVAHLGAHIGAPDERPELAPFLEKVLDLGYEWGDGRQTRRSIRQVRTRQEAGGLAS